MSKPRASLRLAGFIAVAVLLMTQVATARQPVRVDTLDARDTANLESLLRSEVETILRREKARPGEPPATSLLRGVRIDKASGQVVVELSRAYLPAGLTHFSAALQDRLHMLTTGILWAVENELGLSAAGVSYTFDGQPLWFYYPDDFPDFKPDARPSSKADPPSRIRTRSR